VPARASALLNNFTTGELSTFLSGRVDLAKYLNGCERLENWMPLRYGGVMSCYGSRFVASTKYDDRTTRLIPFVYSTLQAYQLEFGDEYIRVYKDGGRIEDPPGTPIEIASPYTESDLALIKFAQSADTLYLVHPYLALRKLTRTSHTSWTLSTVTLTDGPFLDENIVEGYTITIGGDELVTNGTFNTDLNGWTSTSVAPGTITWNAGGSMDLTENAGRGAGAQAITTVAGITYRLTFTVSGGTIYLRIGTTLSGQEILVDTAQAAGSRTVDFVATTTQTFFDFSNTAAATTYGLDNVSCKRLLQAGTTATMTASQDTWEAGHVGAYWRIADAGGSPSHDAWKTATAYVVGDRRTYEDNVYECTVAGTSGTRPPIHLRGTASDGGVTWTFINDGWGYVEITGYTNARSVTCTVRKSLPSNAVSGTTYWSEGAFSEVRGYASAIEIFEQRLLLSSTAYKPLTIYASESGASYESFKAGTTDDAAYIFTVVSNNGQKNAIHWMVSAARLFIGGAGSEATLTGGNDSPVTPTNVLVREQTYWGSANLQGIKAGSSVLFVDRSTKALREPVYSGASDRFLAADRTILSEHITGDGLSAVAFQQLPNPVVWCVRTDGVLAGLTWDIEQDVYAWFRRTTNGTYQSVSVIPNGTADQCWQIVRRTINGTARQFVEYFDEDLNTDCALTYSGSAVTTVSGLDHLIGASVRIVGDGAVYPTQTVAADGSVTLDPSASAIEVGLNYDSDGLTIQPEVKTPEGTPQTIKQRWAKVVARVKSTNHLKINGYEVPFRSVLDDMDEPPPALTGDIEIHTLGADGHGQIRFQRTDPLRVTINGFFGILDIGDR
jgi:hypothetical protein